MKRSFVIFTADGQRHTIEAPTLRTALRNSWMIEARASIVAVIEAGCLPSQPAENRPFCAVFLTNPAYAAPEVLE